MKVLLTNVIVFLLYLGIVLGSMSYWMTYTFFLKNQDYIAKNLCVYKDIPTINCYGSCYLATKMIDAVNQEEQQEGVPQPIVPVAFVWVNHDISFDLVNQLVFNEMRQFQVVDDKLLLPGHHLAIFHPPQG